jgi:uncharacterized protein YciI
MVGRCGDRRQNGAKAIFTAREAAEEFANSGPFVVNGVVRSWKIREGNSRGLSLRTEGSGSS